MNRIYFSLLVAALCGCGAEEPAAEVDPVNDAQPVSDTDADPDGAVRVPDGGLADVGSDTAADAAPPVDAAPDLGPMDPLTCPQVPSPRADDALRVDGCRFRVDGPGTMLPRAVVVSADSLGRELGTPFHESTHYVELAEAGYDLVWLLATWKGVEPLEGQYNGAYMGRVCEHLGWAHGAGLQVVLAMHQDGYGPALGGSGMPDWTAPGAQSKAAAWGVFWARRLPQFRDAWSRLLATCPEEAPPVGIAPLVGPEGGGDAWPPLADEVRAVATARFGPVILFVEPDLGRDGYGDWRFGDADVVFSPSGWGRGAGAIAGDGVDGPWIEEGAALRRAYGVPLLYRGVGADGPEALNAALSLTERIGAATAIWQDGFGGAMALRDEAGVPGPSWDVAARRPWPTRVAGSILGFERAPDGFTLRWWHDGSNQGVSRVGARGFGVVTDVVYVQGGEGELIWAYDPSAEEVTLVVDGPPRTVEVIMSGDP